MKGSSKNKKKSYRAQNDNLKDISFCAFAVLIYFTEISSIIIAILYIILTPWHFVKIIFEIISIISLFLIIVELIITIPIFYKTKFIPLTTDISLLSKELCLINFLLVFYILIIIINLFMAIYISIRLNIADYPEYGGRKRDEEYINNHPNEFGDVSSTEFLSAALLPSLVCFLNLLSLIFCSCFRTKISDLYDKVLASIIKRNENERRKSTKNEMKNDDTKEEQKDDLDFEYNKDLPEEFYFGGLKIEANSEQENEKEEENNNKGNQSKVVKKRRISVVNNLMMPQISSNKNFNANNH